VAASNTRNPLTPNRFFRDGCFLFGKGWRPACRQAGARKARDTGEVFKRVLFGLSSPSSLSRLSSLSDIISS